MLTKPKNKEKERGLIDLKFNIKFEGVEEIAQLWANAKLDKPRP